MGTKPKPDLFQAGDTDEIHSLANRLAWWGIENGECGPDDAVDWVLCHPRPDMLPRGSDGRPNKTEHHVKSGARIAAENWDETKRRRKPDFNPACLEPLESRIAGSGVARERYLLAVLKLCRDHETVTPTVTGPSLADAAGVASPVASRVLKDWSGTLADGFFTSVSYDGEKGHARIWAVNLDWSPAPRFKHEPGCNRSKARCGCRKKGYLYLQRCRDRSPKVRQFEKHVTSLSPGDAVTIKDVCRHMSAAGCAMTTYEAKQALVSEQGNLLASGTYPGGRVRKRVIEPDGTRRSRVVNLPETWFRAEAPEHVLRERDSAEIKARLDARAQRLVSDSVCEGPDCHEVAPAGRRYCLLHQRLSDGDPGAGVQLSAWMDWRAVCKRCDPGEEPPRPEIVDMWGDPVGIAYREQHPPESTIG